MKIGILVTGHAIDELRPTHGDYDSYFARFLDGQGFTFEGYFVVDGQFPDSIHDADGWLITGSRHGVYEDHPWIAPLEQFVRDVYADGRPMVGICFGHQIIAQALGGHVEKFRGGWAVGSTSYDIEGLPVTLNAWHQDQVITPPDGAQVIGSNDFCTHAALLYGDRAYTIQPHPEFGSDVIGPLLETRAPGMVPDDLITAAVDNLDAANDNPAIAARIAAFFKQERPA